MDDISAAVIQLYNQILKPNFFQKKLCFTIDKKNRKS